MGWGQIEISWPVAFATLLEEEKDFLKTIFLYSQKMKTDCLAMYHDLLFANQCYQIYFNIKHC